MSDSPRGPGWWLASDGKYYPPQEEPPPPPPSLPPPPPISPGVASAEDQPSPDWWMASDLRWYPPSARGAAQRTHGSSDTKVGDGWWLASDGRWYAPDGIGPNGQRNPFTVKKRRTNQQRMVFGGIAAAVLLMAGGAWLLFGGGGEPNRPGTDAVAVEFSLLASDLDDVVGTQGDCSGTGGYSDFGPGMDITVTNEDGRIIGSGRTRSLEDVGLNSGGLYRSLATPSNAAFRLETETTFRCTVAALVPLKESANFYIVKIGRRGETSYSREELEDSGWLLQMSLGD